MEPNYPLLLANRAEELCHQLYPLGKTVGQEFLIGDTAGSPGKSLAIQLVGDKAGLWNDRAGDEKGNLIDLVRAAKGLDGKPLFDWIRSWLGIAQTNGYHAPVFNPLMMTFKRKGESIERLPVAAWPYHDAKGTIVAYACRFEWTENGKPCKDVIPSRHVEGKWRWKGWTGDEERPIYNLHLLTSRPEAPVLVVEGEKTCDAASKLFPSHVCITWQGGSKAVLKVDWKVIQGRSITLWPDADAPGRQCMAYLRCRLKTANLVDTTGLPEGWDLADPVPPGISAKGLLDGAQPREESLPFKVLGYDHGNYYYMASEAQQLLCLTAAGHTKNNLLQLASLDYWETAYAGRTETEWDRAINDLLRKSHKRGVFHPNKIRGCGVWKDNGDVVFHAGDTLYVNGQPTPISDYQSSFIYELSSSHGVSLVSPMSVEDGLRYLDICKRLPFKDNASHAYLAGWIVIACICGYVPWRPHIWLTGSKSCGKTWTLENVIQCTLKDLVMCVGGSTTEAGSRQRMKQSALPITYDEAENERQKDIERMQSILNLARCSSSDSSAEQMKGTTSGSGISYRMRSCWCFGSIGAGISMAADASRITTLEMEVRKDPDAFDQLLLLWSDLINQPGFSNAFISRAINLAPVIEANFNNFSSLLARSLGDKRAADQLGSLMAGAYSLTSDLVATEDQAKEFLAQFDLKATATESASTSDEEGCLNHLLDAKLMNGRNEQSIGELLTDYYSTDDAASKAAEDILRRHGIKPVTGAFHVCQNHPELKRIYQSTPWPIQYFRILRRQPDAVEDNVRFGVGTNARRSVKLKWTKPPTELYDQNGNLY